MFKDLKIDKVNYFLFFIFLTLLIIAILQSLLEAFYIKEILDQGLVPPTYRFLGVNSYLSPLVKIALLAVGIAGGYSVGRKNWKRVAQENPESLERGRNDAGKKKGARSVNRRRVN